MGLSVVGAARRRARPLIGPRLGLIQGVRSILLSAGQPRLHSIVATVSETARYMGAATDPETGAIGFSAEQATAGAIGELIERYSAAYCDPSRLVKASAGELGSAAVGMDRFRIHAETDSARPGWPFAPYDPSQPIHWAEAASLIDGSLRYVPACLVYIPYRWEERSDFLALSVSSGNASHTDRDQALLTGLFEVVERDAFMISWERRLRLPRVDFMADPQLSALYERHFAGCNLTFHLFDMTLDIAIPTYLCLVVGQRESGPFVAMGAATRISPREAMTKALLEAAQDMVWCRDLIRRRPTFDVTPDWSNIRSFEDRVRLFCEPSMMEHVGFLLDTPRRVPVRPEPLIAKASAHAQLEHCVALLRQRELEPLVVDQTAPDVAAAGYYAPKVMIPGTAPLTAMHHLPQRGSPRYQSVPIAVGYDVDAYPGFNPIPHLFP